MGPDGHLQSVSAVNGDRSEFVALHESGPSAAGGEVGARAGGDDGLWLRGGVGGGSSSFLAALGFLEAVEVVAVVTVETGEVVAFVALRPAFAVEGSPPEIINSYEELYMLYHQAQLQLTSCDCSMIPKARWVCGSSKLARCSRVCCSCCARDPR